MKNILLSPQLPILRSLAEDPATLMAFDFDGTLTPLCEHPRAAKMRVTTLRLLQKINEKFPCAVITGRSVGDVKRWLPNMPGLLVVGNHGAEGGPKGRGIESVKKMVASWTALAKVAFAEFSGILIEDKKLSLSIHYRHALAPKRAFEQILLSTRSWKGARVVLGKMVVNVVPEGAPDKGVALEWLMVKTKSKRALYIGDDVTDEFAFRRAALSRGRIIGVRVGINRTSSSDYYLANQKSVNCVLNILLS